MSARVKKTAQQIVGLGGAFVGLSPPEPFYPGGLPGLPGYPRGGYPPFAPPSCPPGYKHVWARVNAPVPNGPPQPMMAWVCVPIGVAHKGF